MTSRAWLFTPGDDAHKLSRAFAARAGALILDWEDGVGMRRKAAARRTTLDVLASVAARWGPRAAGTAHTRASDGATGDPPPSEPPRVGIRVNPAASALHAADLDAVATVRPDFVMVPKVASPADLERAAALDVPLVALVESARGLEAMPALAAACASLERLAFGALDLCADVHATWRRSSPLLDYARACMVVASRAGGLAPPIDGVFPDLADPAGLRTEAEAARDAGFAGKMVIHPDQLAPVTAAFVPDAATVERARRVLAAYQRAEQAGSVVAEVDGSLVDAPVVRWARQVLEDAQSPS